MFDFQSVYDDSGSDAVRSAATPKSRAASRREQGDCLGGWKLSSSSWQTVHQCVCMPYLSPLELEGTSLFREFPLEGLTVIVKEGINLHAESRDKCLQPALNRLANPRICVSCYVCVGVDENAKPRKVAHAVSSWHLLDATNPGAIPEWGEYMHIRPGQLYTFDGKPLWDSVGNCADEQILLGLSVEVERFAGLRTILGTVQIALERNSAQPEYDLLQTSWRRHCKVLRTDHMDQDKGQPKPPNHSDKHIPPKPLLEFDLIVRPPTKEAPSFKEREHKYSDLLDNLQQSNLHLQDIAKRFLGELLKSNPQSLNSFVNCICR